MGTFIRITPGSHVRVSGAVSQVMERMVRRPCPEAIARMS
jgi:hypothetical protein